MTAKPSQADLYSVEFALIVLGKGLVVMVCVPEPNRVQIKRHGEIEFVRPDGSVLRTLIRDVDFIMGQRPSLVGLMLPHDVQKDDLPRGTMLRFCE